MPFDSENAGKLMRQLLRDQGCRNRGGRCNCMMLCRLDADEIVQETAAAFREEVREIMRGTLPKQQRED
jgi:hypothetical protein